MAALVTTALNMDISIYDQMSAGLTDPLKAAPGFRSHIAYPVEGGFVVSEIWTSAEDHRHFFEMAVAPNLPASANPRVEIIELRNVIQSA